MATRRESILNKNFLLFPFDNGAQEFNDLAAADAEQMVVVRVVGQMLEGARAIFLQGFARKPGVRDEANRPENRCLAYPRVDFFRFRRRIYVDTEMTPHVF